MGFFLCCTGLFSFVLRLALFLLLSCMWWDSSLSPRDLRGISYMTYHDISCKENKTITKILVLEKETVEFMINSVLIRFQCSYYVHTDAKQFSPECLPLFFSCFALFTSLNRSSILVPFSAPMCVWTIVRLNFKVYNSSVDTTLSIASVSFFTVFLSMSAVLGLDLGLDLKPSRQCELHKIRANTASVSKMQLHS